MLVKSTAVALLAVGSASAAVMSYGSEAVVEEDPDFGLCIPTMKYEGGLGGRSALEFAFVPADPLCARGQQDTLNPNIITNRICDQISTVCGANAPAKILCRESQAKIRALGTRDKSTADTWNTLVGFGGALTNPDGGLSGLGAGELKKRETEDMKKRAPLIACSTEIWIDTCTGWPAPEPVVKKRSEDVAPIVEKRDASPAANPFAKRSEKTKRQRPFVACSAEEWIDTCTGWP